MTRHPVIVTTLVLACLCSVPRAFGFDEAVEKAAIEKRIASYTTAFNAGDAKALADHWLPEAIYINPLSGIQVEGREAIAKEFGAILKELKGAKLDVEVETIRFISPSVAEEDGVVKVLSADSKVDESRYTAIHVKRDSQWYLDRVTEEEVPVVSSHYEQLKELEWMIGTWIDNDDQSSAKTTCQWTRNKNFIVRWFQAAVRDRVDLVGVQIIGWDPSAKEIRSWVFDSDGGFAEGHWTRKDNRWYITMAGMQVDGRKASSVNVITRMDDNHFQWESVNRTVDGQLQPNVDPVVVVRDATDP